MTELNATTGTLIRVLTGSGYEFITPCAIAVDGGRVWVTNVDDNSLTEFPASSQ